MYSELDLNLIHDGQRDTIRRISKDSQENGGDNETL